MLLPLLRLLLPLSLLSLLPLPLHPGPIVTSCHPRRPGRSAPEMLWGARCTEKADIYSYGIVLWEICSGLAPERGRLRDLRQARRCCRCYCRPMLPLPPPAAAAAPCCHCRLVLLPNRLPVLLSLLVGPTRLLLPHLSCTRPITPPDFPCSHRTRAGCPKSALTRCGS